MSQEAEILTAEFPAAVRGYSKVAVDDFVRQMGARLQAMQALLDEKTEMAEARAEALDKMKSDLAAFGDKEAAITKAVLSIEQRRVDVEQELSRLRADSSAECNAALEAARGEAQQLIDAAHKRAEEMQALAEAACALQMERLNALRSEYESAAADIRRTLEAHLALLPSPSDTRETSATVPLEQTTLAPRTNGHLAFEMDDASAVAERIESPTEPVELENAADTEPASADGVDAAECTIGGKKRGGKIDAEQALATVTPAVEEVEPGWVMPEQPAAV